VERDYNSVVLWAKVGLLWREKSWPPGEKSWSRP